MKQGGRVRCPKCHSSGKIGTESFKGLCFSFVGKGGPYNVSVRCEKCGEEIPIGLEELVLSDNSSFQLVGLVGPAAISTPLDTGSVAESATITNDDGTVTTVESGTVSLSKPGPDGVPVSVGSIAVGVRPQFIVSPGVLKRYELGSSYDQILWVDTFLMEPPELRERVTMKAWVERDVKGRSDTLYVVSSVDSSVQLASAPPLNVLCKVCAVPRGANLRPWCRMFLEAISDSAGGMFETACLQYARSCESFVDDFLMESLVELGKSSEPVAAKLLGKMWRIDERLRQLIDLVIVDDPGYQQVLKNWYSNVETPRNQISAHGVGTFRRSTGVGVRDIDALGAREAHESAFALIRGLQLRCQFEEGRQWEHWLTNKVLPYTGGNNEHH